MVPGIGWVGLDPTNNVEALDRHIRVGTGRDYADVSPLKVYTMEAIKRWMSKSPLHYWNKAGSSLEYSQHSIWPSQKPRHFLIHHKLRHVPLEVLEHLNFISSDNHFLCDQTAIHFSKLAAFAYCHRRGNTCSFTHRY